MLLASGKNVALEQFPGRADDARATNAGAVEFDLDVEMPARMLDREPVAGQVCGRTGMNVRVRSVPRPSVAPRPSLWESRSH